MPTDRPVSPPVTPPVTPQPPPPASDARLFLALWPDEAATLAGLRAWQAATGWPARARPTAAANLHLTLHFIGAVPRPRLPEVAAGLALPAPRAELVLDDWSVWPNGVAVLCPRAVPPVLHDLHQALAGRLRGLGLAVDARPWRPHATLARHAAGAALAGAPPPPVRWPVRRGYVLAESAAGYHPLHRYE